MYPSKQEHTVIAVYDSHDAAAAAIQSLRDVGIDPRRLSVIGKESVHDGHAVGMYSEGDRLRFWGGRGAFWGSLLGTLMGGSFLFLPPLGPIVAIGPVVGWIIGAMEGGAVGALAAALTHAGIPKDDVAAYETELKSGNYLVMAHGNPPLIEHARFVLGPSTPRRLRAHSPDGASTHA